jgi:3-oxoacyl-[acyl-carrier-protein] synthase-3
MAKIKAIAYYLPDTTLSNEQISQDFPEWSTDRIESKLGIRSRHIVTDESTSDLAVKAAEKLFTEYNISPAEVDFVILCTQSPDYFLPTTACLVQNRLGIPTSAGAFDFNLGCSGYVYGLAIAKGLVAGGIASNILLITSEKYTKFIHKDDKSNKAIFGDGATATLISTEGFADILDFELGTDGQGGENLIVKNGATLHPNRDGEDTVDGAGNVYNPNNLYMDGPAIFKFTTVAVPKLVENTLLKNNLTLNDIDYTIFHQANNLILETLRKKVGIPVEKYYIDVRDVGNTVSSTIPIAIKESMLVNKLTGNILLVGFGVGYSWGGCILKFN